MDTVRLAWRAIENDRHAGRTKGKVGALTTAERPQLPGMEPKRADVIVSGCAIVVEAIGSWGSIGSPSRTAGCGGGSCTIGSGAIRADRSEQASGIACVATSAARDASNGAAFLEAARARAGLSPEVISGDEEARLVWSSAWRDFGGGPLAVLDVGGGSTEV